MENNEFNWEEVVDFFSKKYILTRPSFIGSSAEIVDGKVNVTLGNKGKFLLLQKNVDKTVSDFIFNTTGKRYEVLFFEPENSDFTSSRESIQDNLIKNMLNENAKKAQEIQLQKNQDELKKKEKKAREKISKQLESIDTIIPNEESMSYTGFPGPSDEELNSLLSSVDKARVWEVKGANVVEVTPNVTFDGGIPIVNDNVKAPIANNTIVQNSNEQVASR